MESGDDVDQLLYIFVCFTFSVWYAKHPPIAFVFIIFAVFSIPGISNRRFKNNILNDYFYQIFSSKKNGTHAVIYLQYRMYWEFVKFACQSTFSQYLSTLPGRAFLTPPISDCDEVLDAIKYSQKLYSIEQRWHIGDHIKAVSHVKDVEERYGLVASTYLIKVSILGPSISETESQDPCATVIKSLDVPSAYKLHRFV